MEEVVQFNLFVQEEDNGMQIDKNVIVHLENGILNNVLYVLMDSYGMNLQENVYVLEAQSSTITHVESFNNVMVV